jgi:hypothetical protein
MCGGFASDVKYDYLARKCSLIGASPMIVSTVDIQNLFISLLTTSMYEALYYDSMLAKFDTK